MVTVELALGFVSVAVVLALVLAVVAAGLARSSVCQAAREAAREASVGSSDPAGAATRSFGRPLEVTVERSDRWVTVRTSAAVDAPAGWVGGSARCQVSTLLEQEEP